MLDFWGIFYREDKTTTFWPSISIGIIFCKDVFLGTLARIPTHDTWRQQIFTWYLGNRKKIEKKLFPGQLQKTLSQVISIHLISFTSSIPKNVENWAPGGGRLKSNGRKAERFSNLQLYRFAKNATCSKADYNVWTTWLAQPKQQ